MTVLKKHFSPKPYKWLWATAIALSSVLNYTSFGLFNTAVAQTTPGTTTPETISTIARRIESLKRSNERWIEIRLATQRLVAWEGKTPVHAVIVSTGKAATPTPTGVYAVQLKYRTARMQGDDYDIPDVPYTMYYSGGYAVHGAYWHRRFGTPVSHGCVNVAVDHAKWLFNWASVGTPVVVRD